MHMNYTRIYRTDVARLLDPDEQVLAVVPCRLAYGAERLEHTAEVLERRLRPLPGPLRRRAQAVLTRAGGSGDRSALDRVIDFLDWPWNRIDWDEKLWGVALAGRSGSHAVRLADAIRDGASPFGVVSSRRLLVMRRIAAERFQMVAEVSRSEVLDARRRGRPLQRGRVVIGFADDSRVAVGTGILLTGQAGRLVAALAHG
jgi:hypothetical protein